MDFDNNVKLVELNSLQFFGLSSGRFSCINLYGNVNIKYSSFFGNYYCLNSILTYYGESINSIDISNSYFNGVYLNTCIIINSAKLVNIFSSKFENGSSYLEEGGIIRLNKSKEIYVKYCTFQDNFSYRNGGIFYIYDSNFFDIRNIEAFNTTALEYGSIMYIYSSINIQTNGYVYDMNIDDIGNIDNSDIVDGGLIACLEGYSKVTMKNINGKNLNVGSGSGLFILNVASSLEINNIYLDDVYGNGINGLILTANCKTNSNFILRNGKFTNFYQGFKYTSSGFIYTSRYMDIIFENCTLKNMNINEGSFIYTINPSTIKLNNFIIDGYFSNYPSYLINNDNLIGDSDFGKGYIVLDNVFIRDFDSMKCLIKSDYGDLVIKNSIFFNICSCLYSSYCLLNDKTSTDYNGHLIDISYYSSVTITNTIFDSIYGDFGFKITTTSYVMINNSEIFFSFFDNGFLFIGETEKKLYSCGHYIIENSLFNSNGGFNGGILKINAIDSNFSVIFKNSTFDNNSGYLKGGVIYSVNELTNVLVSFISCVFTDNSAYLGDISYSFSKETEPYFSNIDELRKDNRAFATNPVEIKFTTDSVQSISLYSGELLPDNLKFYLVDDYGHKYENSIYSFEALDIESLLIFYVEVEDVYNVAVVGQPVSLCWENICKIQSLRIVGNSGNYRLRLRLASYGPIKKFPNDKLTFNITIKECEKPYISHDDENIDFKLCYKPQCIPSCNTGVCINNNVCNCTGTNLRGAHCNEYYKLERYPFIDTFIKIIGIIILIISIGLIIGLKLFEQNPLLRSGGIKILLIILLGIILKCFYIITLTIENKTKFICIFSYLSNNLGFSLIFGSILIKTYTIYEIFTYNNKIYISVKKRNISLIITSFCCFHIVITLLWEIFNKIYTDYSYTTNLKEYINCVFPKSRILSATFNMMILFVGWYLSYANKNVDKKYNENMTIPVYITILCMILMEIINVENEINVVNQDLICAIGTIIHIVALLYCFYITKFYKIFSKAMIKMKNIENKKPNYVKKTNNYNNFMKMKTSKLINCDINSHSFSNSNSC